MRQLELEAAALRRLVERQDFAAMPEALAAYVRRVEAEGSPANLTHALDLIEWARRNLRAAQARLSEERDRLNGVKQYRDSAATPAALFRLDA